jgi:putative ABC transport system ATP-binding protein
MTNDDARAGADALDCETFPAISVKSLVKGYEGRTVLDDLTFSIQCGEFVVVHGKSGCGKTTLLNIIGGLDRPTSGDVLIQGESIVRMTEDQLARLRSDKVGFVFQDYNLLDDLTIKENIELPRRFSGKSVARSADALLEMFSISSIRDELPRKISGGEAQRAAIARAMMNEPTIILADEPTGNLDAENTMKVIEAFRLIQKEFGTTIILATHDLDLTKYSTSRISLESGKARLSTV